jgi:hypothetical protein
MITSMQLAEVVEAMGDQAVRDILWAESIQPPKDGHEFALETIFVICNSGMKNTIARSIFERVKAAIWEGRSASEVFGHKGKAAAIDYIWRHQELLWFDYMQARDKVEFLSRLPWIGNITKFHLAKNFGADVAKPDVHLQRLADLEGVTPQQLCERLAKQLELRVATIDTLLWRACANGVIDSRTGAIFL